MRSAAIASLLAVCLSGCSWLPSWLGGPPSRAAQPTALTDISPTLSTRVAWRASIGAARTELMQPAVTENAVYAAAADGAVVRLAPDSGQVVWRSDVKTRLSAGVGSDGFTVVVATNREIGRASCRERE